MSVFQVHPCNGPNNDRSLATNYGGVHHNNWENNIDEMYTMTACGTIIATVPVNFFSTGEVNNNINIIACILVNYVENNAFLFIIVFIDVRPQIGMLTNRRIDALRHRFQQQQ